MSDNEIKMLLRTMASDVNDVRPLERSALRRARTRRLAVAVTAVVSVLSLAIGGTSVALGAFGNDRPIAPANPAPTPPPPRPMPGQIVAYGTTDDGGEWWLSAYENDAHELCTDLQRENGHMVEDCGPYNRDDVGFRAEAGEIQGAFGWVPDEVEGLWVTWPDESEEDATPEDDEIEVEHEIEEDGGSGDEEGTEEEPAPEEAGSGGPDDDDEVPGISFEGEEELALYDAPEGFPFPVKFYAVVPAPDHADILRIVLKNGDVSVLVFSGLGRSEYHMTCYVDEPGPESGSSPTPGPNVEACEERRRGE